MNTLRSYFFYTCLIVFGTLFFAFGTANAQVSDAPVLNSAVAGNASVVLGWTAPVSIGGSAIANYRISITPSGGSESFQSVANPALRSATVSGLVNGTQYSFKIQARNGSGYSAFSNIETATPAVPNTDVPNAPTLNSATAGDEEIVLSWTAPAYEGGASITRYIVSYTPDRGVETTVNTGNNGTTYTLSGLTNNTEYTIKVSAMNTHGTGSYSNTLTATPAEAIIPVIVGTPVATPSSTSVTLTWSTNTNMSSWVTFGLDSSTAVTTTEINTDTKVASHSVTLSNLVRCTTYSYKVNSRNGGDTTVRSDEYTFTTTGCPLGAQILASRRETVNVATGGIVDFRNSDIKTRFTIPSEVTCLCADMVIQANKLDRATITGGINAPNSKNWLGEHVYKFTAYQDETAVIDEFDLPVDVTITYTREDIQGINLNTLGIHHYNEDTGRWSVLNSCTNSYDSGTGTGSITCSTDSFSTFILATLEEDEMAKPTWRERIKNMFSRSFKPFALKRFSRCDANKVK